MSTYRAIPYRDERQRRREGDGREIGSNEETEIELEIGTEKKSERKRKNASKRIKEKNRREIEEGGNLSKRMQLCK